MAVVLCTGTDDALLASRRMLLESAGHTVVSALGAETVMYACKRGGFDIAIIGQGSSDNDKRTFFALIRQHCPGVKVLELFRAHSHPAVADAEDHMEVPADVPSELIDRVNALAGRRSTRKKS